METLWQDAKYGLRMLGQKPGFTAVAVLTLALGIGANTALFSLLNAAIGKPIPGVGNPDGVVWIAQTAEGNRSGQLAYPDYRHYRDHARSLAGVAAYARMAMSLGSGGEPERVRGHLVSGNYFDVLQTRFQQGRGFLLEEDRAPGTHAVAVISHGLWERRFEADPAIIGRRIILNGHAFTVVGVAAKEFAGTEFEDRVEIWVPSMMQAVAMPRRVNVLEQSGWTVFTGFGRLAPGASRQQATAELRTLSAEIAERNPESHRDLRLSVAPMTGWVQPGNQADLPPILILCGGVTGLVLLITCANLGTLLLSRAVSRTREIAIRLALGADRWRVVRQLLTENLLLALAGAAAGLVLSFWAADIALAVFAVPVPLDATADGRVLLFTILLVVLATAAFGLAPALQASRSDLVAGLKEETVGGTGGSRFRLQRIFVAGQVGLAALLLVVAGLFLRTLESVNRIDVGFSGRHNVLAMSFDLELQGYDRPRRDAFYRELTHQARQLPGVESVSLANNVPLSSTMIATGIEVEDQPVSSGNYPTVAYNLVHPDFFRTIGTPLLAGRDFDQRDGAAASGAVIVNETMAVRFWGGENPVGKRLRIAGEDGPYFEVVGVAGDGKYDEFGERPRAHMYLPHAQYSDGLEGMILLVRAGGDARLLIPSLKEIVRRMDPNLPVYRVSTLAQYIDARVSDRRNATSLLGIFGAVALGLAMIGVYGVMAFHVTQRTREIGIRMALGAQRLDVMRLFVRQGLRLAGLGIGGGLVLALLLTQLLRSLLFGISPVDGVTYAGVAILLGVAALVAAYLPARRATRVDPLVALRYE